MADEPAEHGTASVHKELRRAAAVITTASDLLREHRDQLSEDDVDDVLDRLHGQGAHVSRLVDELVRTAGRSQRTERTEQRPRRHEHLATFFQDDARLAATVSAYVAAELRAGGGALIVATAEHRASIAERLDALGFSTEALVDAGRYVALDARATLEALSVDGRPDAAGFDSVVGTLVREMRQRNGSLRAFGEMVGLLWTDGDPGGALALEQLWNGLRAVEEFSLLCGYPIDACHGGDAMAAGLGRVCASHGGVLAA